LSFTTAVQIEKAIIGKSKRERKREHKWWWRRPRLKERLNA
jgi:hypothetical protein